jgi:hypothetical protein
MTSRTIDINLDKKCVRCGHEGALKNGLCLKCAGKEIIKRLKGDRPMKIGEKTITFIHDTIFNMLHEQQDALNEAYVQAEGDKLTITISATIAPAKRDNETTVKVAMGFVKERVKDELEITIDEAQGELFKEKTK